MSIKIVSLGIGLPAKIVSNDDISKFVETSDQWIRTRTGIENRRVATDETLTDLATTAGQEALKNAKLKSTDIDLIICATLQSDNITPALSCIVQRNLEANCPCFDMNMACSGFIYALEVAKNFIMSKNYKRVMIISADMMSKHVDWTKRDTCVLFGDGAAACIIEAGNNLEYINLTVTGEDKFINHAVSRGNNPFVEGLKDGAPSHHFLHLNGQEVYKFAVSQCTKEIEKSLKTLDITPEKIDNFILHQANKRIIDTVREGLGLGQEKFPTNIQKYGNTSSVSIPLLLYELDKAGQLKRGQRLMLVAFGGGLASAAADIKW